MRDNNNKVVPFITKSLKKSFHFAHRHTPTVLGMIAFVFKALMKPIIAAKAAIVRNTELQQTLKQVPWIPLTLIIFGGMVLMHKDLRFNLNLSAPTSMAGGGGSSAMPYTNGVAQSVSGTTGFFSVQQDEQNQLYISKFSSIAVSEMQAMGIPASVHVAMGMLESQSGASQSARKNNNHFALKCQAKKCRQGHCSNLEAMGHKAFFLKYKSVWEGWRAHSKLLTSGKYQTLLQNKDYQSWAMGLQQLGYNNSPNYAQQLTQLIEYYKLYQLDR